MYIQTVFELSMVLDAEKFEKILSKAYPIESAGDDEYIDRSLVDKGITVVYRDSQYKKRVKLDVNAAWVLDSDKPDPDKLIRKLEKRIDNYFNSKYTLDDFNLTGMTLSTDIDVRDREKVKAYISVLQRVGKVKGFSKPDDSWVDDDISFCLDGNSNGISFMIFDLKSLLRGRLNEGDSERKQLKSIAKKSEGLIRAEVRLTEQKAIRAYTDETDAAGQIADLSRGSEKIFLDTFMRIVPFGDFLKMDRAREVIQKEVTDTTLKRRMLRLLELVPEKRSLLLAQKALNCRRVDDVMEAFSDVECSPVTLSKRAEIKRLDNLYKFM